jgi:predicted nucleic acid-binding protein
MTLVVDASAIAAVLFAEPDGATIRAHVRGESMIAPELIDYELANASLRKIRREPAAQAQILVMLEGLRSLGIKRMPVPATAAATLAARTGLSAYDASYLWLAMANDVELVTLDNKLARINHELREP